MKLENTKPVELEPMCYVCETTTVHLTLIKEGLSYKYYCDKCKMSNIKRYTVHNRFGAVQIVEDAIGRWIKANDYFKLLDDVKKQLESIREYVPDDMMYWVYKNLGILAETRTTRKGDHHLSRSGKPSGRAAEGVTEDDRIKGTDLYVHGGHTAEGDKK